jgi:hypothetical protein
VDCTILHYSAGTITVSAFIVNYTVGGGMRRSCSLQDPNVRLEERPGGLQTPDAWLPGPGAGQPTPAGRTSGYSHLAVCPALGA